MNTFITILLIALASVSKAVADTLQHHYDTSVFKNLSFKFWNPDESYKYIKVLKPTGYRPDAWHLANSAMIVFFILAISFHNPITKWYWEVLAGGVLFNFVFNLLYGKLLRRK